MWLPHVHVFGPTGSPHAQRRADRVGRAAPADRYPTGAAAAACGGRRRRPGCRPVHARPRRSRARDRRSEGDLDAAAGSARRVWGSGDTGRTAAPLRVHLRRHASSARHQQAGARHPRARAGPRNADRRHAGDGHSLPHGRDTVLGFRVGPVAYVTDAKAIPPEARAALEGLEVLVVNALLPRPHPLHLSIPEAVAAAQQIGAARTFLTHLTHDTPHAALAAQLPAGIAPAYDGLVIEIGGV